jgi:hypothetical protein
VIKAAFAATFFSLALAACGTPSERSSAGASAPNHDNHSAVMRANCRGLPEVAYETCMRRGWTPGS